MKLEDMLTALKRKKIEFFMPKFLYQVKTLKVMPMTVNCFDYDQ